jgi:hypothetical protein
MNAYNYENIGNRSRTAVSDQYSINITFGDRLISAICMIVAFFTSAVALKVEKAVMATVCFIAFFGIIGGMEITLADMSGLDLTIMIGMLLAGLGLSIRALVSTPKENGLGSLNGLDI